MKDMSNQTISLTGESGDTLELIVLEKTEFNGSVYILAEDSMEDRDIAYILKQGGEDDKELVYSIVEDDREIEAVAPIFEELLEGEIDLITEDEED